MQTTKCLSQKPVTTRNPLNAIKDDELLLLWKKVKEDPERLLGKLKGYNKLLLLDFVAQLYARDMLSAEDWRLIYQNVEPRQVYSRLLMHVETTRKFQEMALNTLQLGIHYSCKDFNMTSRFYNAYSSRQHRSKHESTKLGGSHHNAAWFSKS